MKIGQSYAKVLIVSSWKMGSTLLTDLIGSHPSSFILYEPLWHFGVERVRTKNEPQFQLQHKVIQDLMNCDFRLFKQTIAEKWPKCLKMSLKNEVDLFFNGCSRDYNTLDKCTNLEYLSQVCKAVPVQIIKLDRMGLNAAREFIRRDNLLQNNVKIIYLVRDPRAVINSRKTRSWCISEPLCIDPVNLCNDIFEDHHVAKGLYKTMPDRFR